MVDAVRRKLSGSPNPVLNVQQVTRVEIQVLLRKQELLKAFVRISRDVVCSELLEGRADLIAGKPRSHRMSGVPVGGRRSYSAGGVNLASSSATFASRLSSRARVRASTTI
jgi:hypothetical protein